jgi:hypothetical protein
MRATAPQRTVQTPAKPVGQKPNRSDRAAQVPAVARCGWLTPQQIKHAVETALRGQTFEADA